MSDKFKMLLSVLQIAVGILAAIFFVKSIVNGGNIEMTLVSISAAVLGLANGIRGISQLHK